MSSEEDIITPILQERKLKCKMLHCSRSHRPYVPEQKFPKRACWPHTLLSTNTTLAWLKSHGMSKYGISSLKMKLKKEHNELTWYQSSISTLIPFLENQNHIQTSSVFFPRPFLQFFKDLTPIPFQFLEMKFLQARGSAHWSKSLFTVSG